MAEALWDGSPALEALCRRIEALQTADRPALVALDGRCGSGKTTLAGALSARFGWSVVPMDDFFLRPEQRSPERYDTPGGNVDYERFLAEVLQPLGRGEAVAYRPFDCRTMALSAPVPVPPSPVTIIEGSYSCHPALWDYYDLRVFLTVDPEEQMRRILRRNGETVAQVFQSRWIPLEELYFSAFDVEARCDLRL